MAIGGQTVLDADGRRIITAEGMKVISDGEDDCHGGIPELLRCSTGTASGIGLLPEHTPAGVERGSTVEYKGVCYTVGGNGTKLTPTTAAVTKRTSCTTKPCGECGGCNEGTTPAHITVTITGFTVCHDCVLFGGHGAKVEGEVNGTYDLPLVSTSDVECKWELLVKGIRRSTYFAPLPPGEQSCQDEVRQGTCTAGWLLTVRRFPNGFGGSSFIGIRFAEEEGVNNSCTALGGELDDGFGGSLIVGTLDCRIWGRIRNEGREGPYCTEAGHMGGGVAVISVAS